MKQMCLRSFAALLATLSARADALESMHHFSSTIRSNIALGADGNIWYGGYGGIGRVAGDGQTLVFPLGQNLEFDFVASGTDGNIWTVERSENTLIAITPSGTIAHSFALPGSSYGAMTAGADGKMWLTSLDVTAGNSLTSVDTEGHVTSYPIPSEAGVLTDGPDSKLWVTSGPQVLRVDLLGSVAVFNMPYEGTASTGGSAIVAGPDGKMWLSANIRGCFFSPCIELGAALASMSTDGVSTIHQAPGNANSARGVAFGADGNPWLLASRFNPDTYNNDQVLLRMAPDGTFTAYLIGGDSSSLVSDLNGNLWFADISNEEITEIPIAADLLFSDAFDML